MLPNPAFLASIAAAALALQSSPAAVRAKPAGDERAVAMTCTSHLALYDAMYATTHNSPDPANRGQAKTWLAHGAALAGKSVADYQRQIRDADGVAAAQRSMQGQPQQFAAVVAWCQGNAPVAAPAARSGAPAAAASARGRPAGDDRQVALQCSSIMVLLAAMNKDKPDRTTFNAARTWLRRGGASSGMTPGDYFTTVVKPNAGAMAKTARENSASLAEQGVWCTDNLPG